MPLHSALIVTVPKFTALIDASSVHGLAQTLRSAREASEFLVVHPSDPAVELLCIRYGARDNIQIPGVTPGAYALDAFHDWLLLLHSGEELSVDSSNALARWRRRTHDENSGYLIRCGDDFTPQLRLVNRYKVHWVGEQPPIPDHAEVFPGLIVRSSLTQAA